MAKLLLAATIVSMLSMATALANCSGTLTAIAGNYEVSWDVIGPNYVMFNVSADTTGWVSIGFSENQLMVCFNMLDVLY